MIVLHCRLANVRGHAIGFTHVSCRSQHTFLIPSTFAKLQHESWICGKSGSKTKRNHSNETYKATRRAHHAASRPIGTGPSAEAPATTRGSTAPDHRTGPGAHGRTGPTAKVVRASVVRTTEVATWRTTHGRARSTVVGTWAHVVVRSGSHVVARWAESARAGPAWWRTVGAGAASRTAGTVSRFALRTALRAWRQTRTIVLHSTKKRYVWEIEYHRKLL